MAAHVHTDADLKAVFPRQLPDERDAENSKEMPTGNGLFGERKNQSEIQPYLYLAMDQALRYQKRQSLSHGQSHNHTST
jgi:hypothetical protein